MEIAAPQKIYISKRLKVTLIISAVVAIFFLGPWFIPGRINLPFEIRNRVLAWLAGGFLGLVSLFVSLSCLMIMAMRYDKWFSGMAMLLFPFLLVPVGLLTFLFMFGPFDKWHDDKVYKSGTEYLIHQSSVDGDAQISRLIKAQSPDSPIRDILQVKPLSINGDKFAGDTVLFEGKRWIKGDGVK